MKQLSFFLTLFSGLLLFSCSTEFSINGEYQETPIVHAIIDANDTIHYIKINKTFLGDGNSFEFAQIPDSSYFKSVEGKVAEFVNGTKIREFTLRDTTITNKEEGVFYAPEQVVYYFQTPATNKLNPEARLDLELDLNNGSHIVTASTELVYGVEVTDPKNITQLNFAEDKVEDKGDYKNEAFKFSEGVNAVVYDYRIFITYNEFTAAGSTQKTLEWKIGEQDRESTTLGLINMNGINFYELLRNSIPQDEDVIKRTLHSMRFQVVGGSEDLYNYILVNKPSSSLAQNKPTFTNLDGALGVFTSRMKHSITRTAFGGFSPNSRILSVNSTKELCQGAITSPLLFCSDFINDQNYNFYCN
ncbi:protein of unknown function [Lishizhenia tianjinensis]|uniref:DUF4249 domain-containing protein n=1 Tax=Lishizhenia tianjinensis TaxID=477690 RepID=A0A1I6YS82_9FLAO|nr:DUF4249 family protein [Lishizhenia tianjinensis]SFT53309.1 protein of unknown function [Lishizhenia tianjinensis]